MRFRGLVIDQATKDGFRFRNVDELVEKRALASEMGLPNPMDPEKARSSSHEDVKEKSSSEYIDVA